MSRNRAALEAASLIAANTLAATSPLAVAARRPRVGIGAILLDASRPGRTVAGARLGAHGAGRWALPGGHLEFGQSWGECASMEVAEECGVAVPPGAWHVVGVTNDVMAAEDLHYVTVFVAARVGAAALAALENKEPDKCAGWAWVTWEELADKPIFLPLKNFLDGGGAARAAALAE